MVRQDSHMTPNESQNNEHGLPVIFIGRERQLDEFTIFLERWQRRMGEMRAGDELEPTVPTPTSRIQGLVVMLFGRGGFGKSSLLRRYRALAEAEQSIKVAGIVDWEFAIESRRGLFNPPKGQAIDPVEYYKALAVALAPTLDKKFDDCKHLQRALQDVEKAQKDAHYALESLQQDDRYDWLRGLAVEGVTTLIRAYVPGSASILDDPGVKQATDATAKLTQEQINRLLTHLRQKLKDSVSDYLEPAQRLGLALGDDLRGWARNHPLLICFDTYEEIDEGDALLRIVMGAAGLRVGWLIAGRDNLWGGSDQIERDVEFKYGYKDIVSSDRSLPVNFNASDVGAFSPTDIVEYFTLLREKLSDPARFPPLSADDAKRIWRVTQGIPLAVNIAAALYYENAGIEAITEEVKGKKDIVDGMVNRYLLHTRSNLDERHKLYGIAMLRRADQPHAICAALNLTGEQASAGYSSELSYLHRRYSFIFTEKDIPSLHQEVRHFLRLWLLERRTQPEIAAVNQRLLAAQTTTFTTLEEQRAYTTLKERLQDDEWVEAYLDLAEQHYWSNPVTGLTYLLPFMIAAAVYRRDANEDAAETGNFFQANLHNPYKERWQWASGGLVESKNPLVRIFRRMDALEKLEKLERLATQRCPIFPAPSPLPGYKDELRAALWWRLGKAYRKKDDNTAIEWYEKALPTLREETKLREDTASAYFDAAYKLFDEKKYTETVDLLTRAIELKPDYTFAYGNRGNAYANLKQYDDAIADYSHVITLDPSDARAYNHRGNAYLWLRDSLCASADYKRGYELRPKDINAAWMALWVSMDRQRLDDGFAAELESIVEINTEDYVAYVGRGLALGLRGRLKEGLEELEKAIPLKPEEWDAYFWKGMLCAYYYRGRPQMAIEAIEKALNLEHGLPPVLLTPLYWLEADRPECFALYKERFLDKYGV